MLYYLLHIMEELSYLRNQEMGLFVQSGINLLDEHIMNESIKFVTLPV